MTVSPRDGLRHPYRCIHPHKTVRQVAVGPSGREVPQMHNVGRIPVAGLLRGRLCSPEGGISCTSETRGVSVAMVHLFWGIRRCPPWGDFVA